MRPALRDDLGGTLDDVEDEAKRILEIGNRLFAGEFQRAARRFQKPPRLTVVVDIERRDERNKVRRVAVDVETQLSGVEFELVQRPSDHPESKALPVKLFGSCEVGYMDRDLAVGAESDFVFGRSRHRLLDDVTA